MLRQKRVTPVRPRICRPALHTPLHEAAAKFVAWTVAVGMSPETARIRRAALDRFAAWCDGQAVGSPAQLTHNHLEAYQGYLAAYRKADGNLIAATTRAARMNPVLAFCRWLSRESLVEDGPYAGKRRRHSIHPGNAGPCAVVHHGDIHAGVDRQAEGRPSSDAPGVRHLRWKCPDGWGADRATGTELA